MVAHAYTRYLGDLSGGQVLGKITQKSLGLSSKDGLEFFSFPGVTSPNRFKQLYRSRMNSIELTDKEKAEMLEEAVASFEFNIQVRLSYKSPITIHLTIYLDTDIVIYCDLLIYLQFFCDTVRMTIGVLIISFHNGISYK